MKRLIVTILFTCILANYPTVVLAQQSVWSRFERAALTNTGDAEMGKRLFFEDQRTKCSVCHRVGSEGGAVGPELTQIGGKFDRSHLIESLLEPSRQIVEGFRTSIFDTAEGTIVSGVVKSRSDHHVNLLDANNRSVQLAVADIQQEKVAQQSIMPEGLANELTEREFTDLVAYLESLQSGPKKFGAGVHGAISLPDGFQVKTIATGLSGAVAMAVSNDGRIFICEQQGTLRVVRNGKLLPQPVAAVPAHMQWERGLIGVAVDPQFDSNGQLYLCYVTKEPYIHHVISRITIDGDNKMLAGSEKILLEGDDQSMLGGNVPAGHQGGAMHFGPDGNLYIAIGEQTAGLPSQSTSTLLGKILRISPDGSIPKDNPFVCKTEGKYQSIWAYGLRNPFTFAIHPKTGEMLANDVGGVVEEINRIKAGGNYGWPSVEHGPTDDRQFVGPVHTYPQASISGGAFVPEDSPWPMPYRGKYLFADFVHGWIHSIDPAKADAVSNNSAEDFVSGLRRPVDLRFSSDGGLYVLLRNAWVVDDKFVGGTGSLLRIDYGGQ
jgi:putative heme-binding domain-containing protein